MPQGLALIAHRGGVVDEQRAENSREVARQEAKSFSLIILRPGGLEP
jgi:hypothetical protein